MTLKNNHGIALVTSLMFTLISLTICMYLLSMIFGGIKVTSANKRYKTALEASYGATELLTSEIIPSVFSNTIAAGGTTPADTLLATYQSSGLNMTTSSNDCMTNKLLKPSAQWSSSCSKTTDAAVSPDISLQLRSTSDDPYTVNAKIVETICGDTRPGGACTGSDLSGITYLDSGSGTSGGNSGVNVKQMPAIYKIEVSGQRTNSPQERSKLSVLYSY